MGHLAGTFRFFLWGGLIAGREVVGVDATDEGAPGVAGVAVLILGVLALVLEFAAPGLPRTGSGLVGLRIGRATGGLFGVELEGGIVVELDGLCLVGCDVVGVDWESVLEGVGWSPLEDDADGVDMGAIWFKAVDASCDFLRLAAGSPCCGFPAPGA